MRNDQVRVGVFVVCNKMEYFVKANIPRTCLRCEKKSGFEKGNKWILANRDTEIEAECKTFDPITEERGGIEVYIILSRTQRKLKLSKEIPTKIHNTTLSDF